MRTRPRWPPVWRYGLHRERHVVGLGGGASNRSWLKCLRAAGNGPSGTGCTGTRPPRSRIEGVVAHDLGVERAPPGRPWCSGRALRPDADRLGQDACRRRPGSSPAGCRNCSPAMRGLSGESASAAARRNWMLTAEEHQGEAEDQHDPQPADTSSHQCVAVAGAVVAAAGVTFAAAATALVVVSDRRAGVAGPAVVVCPTPASWSCRPRAPPVWPLCCWA